MDDLIAALKIFRRYTDDRWPTMCEHDVLIVNVNPDNVSEVDRFELKELSFTASEEFPGCFVSFRFGSC